MKLFLKVIALVLALIIVPTAYAAIPHTIAYQGKATDKQGMPLTGAYSLTFRLYASETGGSPEWTETQTGVAIANGVFSVQLGSLVPLNLTFDKSYWMTLEINSDGEMAPRTKLASVPYAYKAENADNGVPTGAIMAWTADNPPAGWLICDGRELSRSAYANLFAVIGTTYGVGDGSTTFNLPDLKGRIPVGCNSADTEFSVLNKTGGVKTHAHGQNLNTAYGIQNSVSGSQQVLSPSDAGSEISSQCLAGGSTTLYQVQTGVKSVSAMMPYVTVHYIIKT
jgi:microcystin-dependent protein